MHTIHHFYEAHQHFQRGLIPKRLLQEQAFMLIGTCSNSYDQPINPTHMSDQDIGWLLQQPEATFDYSVHFGGYAYVCQNEADLLQIKGCDLAWAAAHDGDWPNVTDLAMSWDGCSYLEEAAGEPQWVIFLLCWNNAGGPIYYVPKQLWALARVTEHIAATANM